MHLRDNDNGADERLTLTVGGVSHSDWTQFMVDASFITPADAWHLSVGLDEQRLPSGVASGARATLSAGHDVIMTGLIDDIHHTVARGQHQLTFNGRDNAAALVDCSAPVFTAQHMTLAEVVDKIVRPLGIHRVTVHGHASAAPKKFNIEPGETAWDALQKVAEVNGLWPWVAPDGELIVGGPDYHAPPVDTRTLRRDGSGDILSLTRSTSCAGRFSEVTVLAQSHGTEEREGVTSRKATASDDTFHLYRPFITVVSDADSDREADVRARKLLSDSRLKALTITLSVRGMRTRHGVLWAPGQRVVVKSDIHGIDGVFFVMSRTFRGGRGIPLTTTLTLKEDGVWIPDMPTSERHKHHKDGKLWTDWRNIPNASYE